MPMLTRALKRLRITLVVAGALLWHGVQALAYKAGDWVAGWSRRPRP